MALTKCKYCTDQHICHHIFPEETSGEVLYNRLHELIVDGKIGVPSIPWEEVPMEEKTLWDQVANT